MYKHYTTSPIFWLLIGSTVLFAGLYGCSPFPEENEIKSSTAFEEFPTWKISKIIVSELTVNSERTYPDSTVTFTAKISNRGMNCARGVQVKFFVDSALVYRTLIEELAPGGTLTVDAPWRATGTGRKNVRVVTIQRDPNKVFTTEDNWAECSLWIGGEKDPKPDLLIRTVDFTKSPVYVDRSAIIPFSVHNPSFATTSEIPIRFSIDGEVLFEGTVRALSPGDTQEFAVKCNSIEPGEHILKVDLVPGGMSNMISLPPGGTSWAISIPGPSKLYTYPAAKDQWASVGPSILGDGNAGRMEDLVFDTQDERIAYGVTEVGGIWKTTDFGTSWTPIGDKLPTMNFFRIAVDPKYPKIVYAATQFRDGLWKSIDGGDNWCPFAMPSSDIRISCIRSLVVRHRNIESDEVLIYIGCDSGLLQYVSSDPWSLQSQYSEWTYLINDPIWDIAVHPNNPNIIWASVNRWLPKDKQELDHIAIRLGANSPWQTGQGLPTNGLAKIDVSNSTPKVLYASVWSPAPDKELAIYRSTDSGITWKFICDYDANKNDYDKVMYNPFIRIDPYNLLIVYIAGTRLYRVDINKALNKDSDHTEVIDAGHYDIKELVFLKSLMPKQQGHAFWVLSDGGIWYVSELSTIVHRNNELRNIQFYDLTCSSIDRNLMLGGTQDNGTLRYRGYSVWEDIAGGDGHYSLISPLNTNRMYAQYQYLKSVRRTDNGLDGKPEWQDAFGSGADTLHNIEDGFFTCDPNDDQHLLAVGDQVHETENSGDNWKHVGPVADIGQAPVRGSITRVLFQPGTDSQTWIAGTSEGQIWYHTKNDWVGIYEHCSANGIPDPVLINSMAFDPNDNQVLWVSFLTNNKDSRIYRIDLNVSANKFLPISSSFPVNVTLNVICGDPHSSNIVYVGTDHGIYRGISFNNVDYIWAPYNEGFPLVKVTALQVNMIKKELIAGTNGRGAWAVKTR